MGLFTKRTVNLTSIAVTFGNYKITVSKSREKQPYKVIAVEAFFRVDNMLSLTLVAIVKQLI